MMDGRDQAGRNDGPGGVDEHLDEAVLNAFLDPIGAGGLDPTARAAADAHLMRCSACREALHELEGTIALLRTLPQIAPRRSFVLTPETVEAVGGKARRGGRAYGPRLAWVWPVRWASALAALLLAITIGLDPSAGPASSVAPPAPRIVSQAATATIAVAPATAAPSPTVGPFGAPEGTTEVSIFGLNLSVFPTPTPAATAAAEPAPLVTVNAWAWRLAEVTLGGSACALAFVGFLVPPILRRRVTAT